MKLAGKVAIVTGASRLDGIGAAICLELAKNGCDVFFSYWTQYDQTMPWGINDDEPQKLMAELRETGVKAASLEINLAKPDAPGKLIKEAFDKLGSPDILVNNATYSTQNSFSDLTAEELDRHYFINIRATAILSSEFAKTFTKKTGGRIINVTSGQFQGPMPGELAYAATKGAVDALTITLAAETAHLGITVNAINPGPTDTGWMTETLKNDLLPKFPFGRVGKPQDAARLVNYLASSDADWITGQIIHSEGGFIR